MYSSRAILHHIVNSLGSVDTILPNLKVIEKPLLIGWLDDAKTYNTE